MIALFNLNRLCVANDDMTALYIDGALRTTYSSSSVAKTTFWKSLLAESIIRSSVDIDIRKKDRYKVIRRHGCVTAHNQTEQLLALINMCNVLYKLSRNS